MFWLIDIESVLIINEDKANFLALKRITASFYLTFYKKHTKISFYFLSDFERNSRLAQR